MNRIPVQLAKRLKTNPFRKQNTYIMVNGHRVLSNTVCKRCGTVLTAVGPDPRMKPTVREIKGTDVRTIIHEVYVSRQKTPEFASIEFEVCDGEGRYGAHRTTLCKTCKRQLIDGVNDIDEVQQLYEADMERMALEDEAQRIEPAQTVMVLSMMMERKVTKVLG